MVMLTGDSSSRCCAGDGNWMGCPSLSDTNDQSMAEWLQYEGSRGVHIPRVHLKRETSNIIEMTAY